MDATVEAPAPRSNAKMLADIFRSFLPRDAVLTDTEDLRPYECDGLSAYRRLPMIVLMPHTVEQVREILRICSKHATPVVARGAGTGLSGGALPATDGVLLSLTRFDQILKVDPENRCATVQPGVRNLAVSEAAAPYGLFYAPDPSSQIACSIGGNVAENSGGVHCLKYGLTGHNLLALKVVTIEGELLTVGSQALDSPGYDLLALMTGSEGMLGVIVEVTVKLLPVPECAQVLMAAFEKVEDASNAVAAIIGAGIIPAGLEMMDKPAIRAAEDFVHAGYPKEAAAMLLCELDGGAAEVKEQIERVRGVLDAHSPREVRIARDDQGRARFWAGRKASFPAVGRISPDYYCMDGTIPRKHIAHVLARMSELSEHYGLGVANVFHAGDGNLHPLILYDANVPDQLERAEAFGGKILELCIEVGGTVTGEHGVGMEKLDQMCVQFRVPELEQFHAVKAAFDPNGLLNPGKAVPTLHRCAEFGAMHVHQGRLPHSELPRF
jgi:glycolate oxidase